MAIRTGNPNTAVWCVYIMTMFLVVVGTTSGISAPSVYPHLEEVAQGLCLCVRTGAGLMLVWWSLQSLAT